MFRWMSIVSALFLALPATAQEETGLALVEEAFVRAVEKARASVVAVTSEYEIPSGRDKDEKPEGFEVSFSGVVLDDQGHIVTVASAARDAKTVVVTTADETDYVAEVVGIDDRSNLAVLRIDAEGLVPIEFADPKSIRLGSWVIEVGNAFGMAGSVSYGIVSGLDRNLGTDDGVLTNMLQTTAPVNPGDSGGLLANTKGQLVGIITSTFQRAPSMSSFEDVMKHIMGGVSLDSLLQDLQELPAGGAGDAKRLRDMMNRWMRKMAERAHESGRRGGTISGHLLGAEAVNFATPVETVRFVTDQLIARGRVERGWLGVEVRSAPAAVRRKLGLPRNTIGLLVEGLVEDGPAKKGGLRVDDVILKVNGNTLSRLSDLERLVAQSAGGTQITLEVSSGGERREIVVKLGTRPEGPR